MLKKYLFDILVSVCCLLLLFIGTILLFSYALNIVKFPTYAFLIIGLPVYFFAGYWRQKKMFNYDYYSLMLLISPLLILLIWDRNITLGLLEIVISLSIIIVIGATIKIASHRITTKKKFFIISSLSILLFASTCVMFFSFPTELKQMDKHGNAKYYYWEPVSTKGLYLNVPFYDLENNKYFLKNLKGKYAYINVWSTTCIPSLQNIDDYEKIKVSFLNDSNIVFVDIAREFSFSSWKKEVLKYNLTGRQLVSIRTIGENDRFSTFFHSSATPQQILLGPSGEIIGRDFYYTGEKQFKQLYPPIPKMFRDNIRNKDTIIYPLVLQLQQIMNPSD